MKIEELYKDILDSIREAVVQGPGEPYIGISYLGQGGVRLYVDAVIDFKKLVEKLEEKGVLHEDRRVQ